MRILPGKDCCSKSLSNTRTILLHGNVAVILIFVE